MEKHFRHLSYRPSKLSNRFQGNLAFTVLCLITLGSGIAMLSLKHYQYKRYWQRIHRNYYEEKQALEFCFAAFKQLKKAVTKDTVITYESNGKLYFRDTITKEDLVDLDEIFFEDSVKISIFSNSDTKQYISCLSQKEGMRQSLEDLFKKEKPPEELKEKEQIIEELNKPNCQ